MAQVIPITRFIWLFLVMVLYCKHKYIHCATQTTHHPLVPALFLFGDSLLDPGNNNDLLTLAKVNYYPYGMDFPGGAATGRFSNGYNAGDYIAFQLGLPLIPAYRHPATKGRRLLQGVNFASGGAGIQSTTGKLYGDVTSLKEQIQHLGNVKQDIIKLIGDVATNKLFKEASFMVVAGSNDWLLSFFSPIIPNIHLSLMSPNEYGEHLIKELLSHVKKIYAIGGRTIIVSGLPALGCCPSQLLEYGTNGSCVSHINKIAQDYNESLLRQLMALNNKLPGANVVYINIFSPTLEANMNPSKFGFKTGTIACCGIGKFKGFLTCLHGFQPCDNVEEHLYWDAYHPTQNFYPYLISILWNNGPPYAYPKRLKDIFKPTTVMEHPKNYLHIEL